MRNLTTLPHIARTLYFRLDRVTMTHPEILPKEQSLFQAEKLKVKH